MQKKLLIGLLITIFSISGVAGYVVLQTGGTTPAVTANTGNLIPEAAFENTTHTTLQVKREICTECAGTGWDRQIACPECNGSGVLECTACNGTGEYLNGTICPYCHGTGEIICQACHGTGGTRCKFCGGDGYYDPEKGDKKANITEDSKM